MKSIAPITLDANTADATARVPAARLVGVVVVALLPALFWTGIVALVSHLTGLDLSNAVLVGTAAAIMVFLTVIYAAISNGSDKA